MVIRMHKILVTRAIGYVGLCVAGKLDRNVDRMYPSFRAEEVNIKEFHLFNIEIRRLGHRPREATEKVSRYYMPKMG